jgi:hypothetical protein
MSIVDLLGLFVYGMIMLGFLALGVYLVIDLNYILFENFDVPIILPQKKMCYLTNRFGSSDLEQWNNKMTLIFKKFRF